MKMITADEFKECLPKSMHNNVSQAFIDSVNNLQVDPEAADLFRDNLVTYSDVLKEGRYKMTNYVEASLFIAFKMQGKTNFESWCNTFPHKYKKYVKANVPDKDLYAYASTYNKGKLVQAISERSMAVDHVLFADIRHRAIRRQAELMMSDNEHVAQKAADSLMNHLKAPEESKVKVDIGVNDNDTIQQLQATLGQLANVQRELIANGATTAKAIAHAPIVIDNSEE